jgi:nicotinamidase-related amidase
MIYELQPARTALLVIDAQREYFDEDGALFTPHAGEIHDNLTRLIDAARAAGAQVVFIRHVMAADGTDAGRMGDFDGSPSFVAGTKGVELADGIEPASGEREAGGRAHAPLRDRPCSGQRAAGSGPRAAQAPRRAT